MSIKEIEAISNLSKGFCFKSFMPTFSLNPSDERKAMLILLYYICQSRGWHVMIHWG